MRQLWRLPGHVWREARAGPVGPRVPEPMVMDDPESVSEFHEGGTKASGMLAVYDLNARALDRLVPKGGRLLDLGVGSGRALNGFLSTRPDVTATAVDLSPNMLATAGRLFESEGVKDRVSLVEADITALPAEVTGEKWDAISCVWCLHHLPDADVLQGALKQIAYIREHGSAVWILDFHRPRHPETARLLLDLLEPDMSAVLRQDALASVAAAWTHEEIRTACNNAGLADLLSGVARPIRWLQAFWSEGRDSNRKPLGRPARLTGPSRLDAAMLRRGFSRLPFKL